ncbi:MAG: TauD/TfdA family dioxygenase [Pseudomonadota bacterium]
MKVEPVSGALGAEVGGIDLKHLSPEEEGALKTALDRYQVIRIRDQSLDRFQLAAFGLRFGPPFLHPLVDNGYSDCPEVLELLREPEDAEMFGGESWHSDITWLKPAGYASILHGVELPEVGGDTAFASTIAAFETLSEGLKQTLRGLTALHAYHWYERREDPQWTAEHPVVRRIDDGREALYVTRMFTSRFKGMSVEESRPLLNYLFAHQERAEFTCRFRWRLGDVLVWDNRFCLHYPINDFALPHGHRARRRMIRTSSMEA